MKTLIYSLVALFALAGAAMEQEAPTAASVSEDANRIIKVLQEQRNNATDAAAGAQAAVTKAQAENEKLRKEIVELKAAEAKAKEAAKPADPAK